MSKFIYACKDSSSGLSLHDEPVGSSSFSVAVPDTTHYRAILTGGGGEDADCLLSTWDLYHKHHEVSVNDLTVMRILGSKRTTNALYTLKSRGEVDHRLLMIEAPNKRIACSVWRRVWWLTPDRRSQLTDLVRDLAATSVE